jgi:HEAT repeat protein
VALRSIALSLLVTATLGAAEPAHILYLAHRGELAKAVQQYESYQREQGHDFGLVRSLATAALRTAAASDEPQIRSVALFGAAYSGDRSLLDLLGHALEDPTPERQMQAVGLLSGLDEEAAGKYLHKALGSPYPPIRIEACFGLARRGEDAAAHVAPLLEYGEAFQAAACEILAAQDSPRSSALMQRMMVAKSLKVRAAAVWCCGERRRDDFLPLIRQMLTHIDPVEQEACCVALGRLGDSAALPTLRTIAQGRADLAVRLAALKALYQLGERSSREQVEQEALQGNRFAISLLGSMEGSEPVLLSIAQGSDPTLRTLACLALLERRHSGCWPGLRDLLVRDARDLIWLPDRSPGFSLATWKKVPSAEQACAKQPHLFHWADRGRLEALLEASHLPAPLFLNIAQTLLETGQNDLVLVTVQLLEQLGPEATQLLQRMSDQAGAPFVRTACHLALMRMGEPGPHRERLIDWLDKNSQKPLELRQTIRPDPTEVYRVTLTPDERSQLILDIGAALARHPSPESISSLLELLAHGHPTIRVAIAACLLHALV